jgi:glycosyl transferase family 11
VKPLTFPLGEHGRLGNSMHQLAATVGIARTLDRPVQFSPDWEYLPFLSIPDEWLGTGPAQDVRRHVRGSHWRRTYMQDPALWAHSSDEIRRAFQPSPRALAVLDAIPSPSSHDVAAHVRRTDYAQFPNHLPMQHVRYYAHAVMTLFEADPLASTVHVYGDDLEWARVNMAETFIYHEPTPTRGDGEPVDWLDLFAMARYPALIIANSSYSFWSAYLAGASAKVVAPVDWFGPAINMPSPARPEWIVLGCE